MFRVHGEKIVCLLCHHYCHLRNGQQGFCGVQINNNGTLACQTYGHPSALHNDPIEKKPLYHFYPGTTTLSLGTVGCNFACPFCQNWQISQKKTIPTTPFIAPEMIVQEALRLNASSLSYTYNEPTVFYQYARDIGLLAKKYGLKNIFVTNGFQTPALLADMATWVDAVNIDLKSFSPTYYAKTLKGGLEAVKKSIQLCFDYAIHVEITTLLIPNVNDSDDEIQAMAQFITSVSPHIPWHLSAFHPDYKLTTSLSTSVESLFHAQSIGKMQGLHHIYIGNIPIRTTTFCPLCQTELMYHQGFRTTSIEGFNGVCPKCQTQCYGQFTAHSF